MKNRILNASTFPRRYFGLHMVEGVAEYTNPGEEPYRIFIGENAIKAMDKSFEGKPVYVDHVDEVDVADIHLADGYVIRSFFNKADGKHWAEFLVTTDKGHEAIRAGWKLSNAYLPKPERMRGGGHWHGVEYAKEVMEGEYEHLAIVQSPRYEESIILTPEQFKEYNDRKESELNSFKNSKEQTGMKFNFFTKAKVENSAGLESTMVELPESKKSMSLSEVIVAYDKIIKNGYHCNGDERVKVGEGEMAVNELVSKHLEMVEKEKQLALNAKTEEELANEDDEDEIENMSDEEKEAKKNADDKAAEEKKNADDAAKKADEEKKKNSKDNLNKLKNAAQSAKRQEPAGELSEDRVSRGKSRYGSN